MTLSSERTEETAGIGSEAVETPRHSLGWRFLTFLAVDLTLTTGFMVGKVLDGDFPLDAIYLARMSLAVFGIQAVGILLWLGFDAIHRRITLPRIKLPHINLRRPWWRFRARIRKRFIRDRSKHDYRSAEGSILVPLVLVGGLFSLSFVTMDMVMAVMVVVLPIAFAAAAVVLATTVASCYKGAADRPVWTMITASIYGLLLGYFVEFS